jgi:hypothetical protein
MLLWDDAFFDYMDQSIEHSLSCDESNFYLEHYDYLLECFPRAKQIIVKSKLLDYEGK